MPLKLGTGDKTFDSNFRDFLKGHMFPKGTTNEDKRKQSLAVAYSEKRKAQNLTKKINK